MHDLYSMALKSLSEVNKKPQSKVAMGFDGFVDIISRPILSTEGGKQYFPTISSFGDFISGKAALSCCIEMDTLIRKFGGNMPNYASSLSALGVRCDCIGAFGYPELNDIFLNLGKNASLTSVAEAGTCNALEFDDGKVMLADNSAINSLDYSLLLERVGKDKLVKWIEENDAFGLFCWSELPGMTSVWQGFLDEIFPMVKFQEKKLMVIDISDCSRRSASEIREMGGLMKSFGKYFKVVFSLNLNECMLVSSAFGKNTKEPKEAGQAVYEALAPHALVIHLLDGVMLFENAETLFLPTKRVASPKVSTGGGDNFNAGLSLALLKDMPLNQSVAVANAVSSYYVANGKSASYEELLPYIEQIVGQN